MNTSDAEFMSLCMHAERIAVVSTHPDDEAIGASVLISRARELKLPVTLIFVSNGVPAEELLDPDHACSWGGASAYTRVRNDELQQALSHYGVDEVVTLGVPSREVLDHMVEVHQAISACLSSCARFLLVGPAFEGGHPDHDAVNCICTRVATASGSNFVEYLGYNLQNGRVHYQEFLPGESQVFELACTPTEVEFKRKALETYVSQQEVILKWMRPDIESYRRLPENRSQRWLYPSRTFYEVWNSGTCPEQVTRACNEFVQAKL